MKTHTDLDTLSNAWTLLNEIGLAGLITGKAMKVDPDELLGQLFVQRKLVEFIAILTHEEHVTVAKLDLQEVIPILADFFTSMSADLQALPGLLSVQMSPKPKNHQEAL